MLFVDLDSLQYAENDPLVGIDFISGADRFECQTQINDGLLPALGFLEREREINHNRYSWNRKK